MIDCPVDPVDVVKLRKIRQVADKSALYAPSMATDNTLTLGNFSVSLAVRDLSASRAFYEKLGFSVIGGDEAQNWLILQNGAATVGLFRGMFERNTLTFNPGWDAAGNALMDFVDVREVQRRLKGAGIQPSLETEESGRGPAHFVVVDPDGNPVLFDQHV